MGPKGGVIVCAICHERRAVQEPTRAKSCHVCRKAWTNQTQRACGALYRKTEGGRRAARAADRRRQAKHQARKDAKRLAQRAEIFMAAGWVCQLCNEPIVRTQIAPGPLAPTVDHAVPLSRGGGNELSNLLCAHHRCNMLKGTMTLEEWHGRPRART